MPTMTQDAFESRRDRFREAVLAAMDTTMDTLGHELDSPSKRTDVGARDEDLPTLFKTLDWQFANNMARLGWTVAA